MGKLGGVTVLILVLVVMFFRQAIGLYVDWLWFQDVGYGQLFGTILSYKFVLGASAGVLLGLLIYINLKIASSSSGGFRFSSPENIIELPPPELIDPILKRLLLPGALLIGLMAAPKVPQVGNNYCFFLIRLLLICRIPSSAAMSAFMCLLCPGCRSFITGEFSPSV